MLSFVPGACHNRAELRPIERQPDDEETVATGHARSVTDGPELAVHLIVDDSVSALLYAPVGVRRAVRNNWASSRVVVASSAALSSRHRPVNRGKRMPSPASSSMWPQAAV